MGDASERMTACATPVAFVSRPFCFRRVPRRLKLIPLTECRGVRKLIHQGEPMTKAAKRNHKSKSHGGHKQDPLVQSAVKLIDKAASLLKEGVVTGADKTAGARHAMKLKASSLVHKASLQLQDAIEEGAAALRKGLKKL
jgi:hypothetical protein